MRRIGNSSELSCCLTDFFHDHSCIMIVYNMEQWSRCYFRNCKSELRHLTWAMRYFFRLPVSPGLRNTSDQILYELIQHPIRPRILDKNLFLPSSIGHFRGYKLLRIQETTAIVSGHVRVQQILREISSYFSCVHGLTRFIVR